MSLSDVEFRVLRETIAARGTVRMVAAPADDLWLGGRRRRHPAGDRAALRQALLAGRPGRRASKPFTRCMWAWSASDAICRCTTRPAPTGPLWESTAMRIGPWPTRRRRRSALHGRFRAATMANLVLGVHSRAEQAGSRGRRLPPRRVLRSARPGARRGRPPTRSRPRDVSEPFERRFASEEPHGARHDAPPTV